MIRQVVSGFLHGHDPIVAERWYYRYHSKECVRAFGPWLRRYETYKTLPPPPQAERFGVRNSFLTELWYANLEDYVEADPYNRKLTPMTSLPSGTAEVEPCHILVTARPTEDFLGKEPALEEVSIMRWFCLFRYPEGVSPEEGERWYLDTHSQEVKEQPGLLKYVSHRALENPLFSGVWHRMSELWYENMDAWRRAVVDSPPRYTPPPWNSEYPFVHLVSVFVRNTPDVDFLKDNPIIP
jgi:hypothetical protein